MAMSTVASTVQYTVTAVLTAVLTEALTVESSGTAASTVVSTVELTGTAASRGALTVVLRVAQTAKLTRSVVIQTRFFVVAPAMKFNGSSSSSSSNKFEPTIIALAKQPHDCIALTDTYNPPRKYCNSTSVALVNQENHKSAVMRTTVCKGEKISSSKP